MKHESTANMIPGSLPFSLRSVVWTGMVGSFGSSIVLFVLFTLSAAVSKAKWTPNFIFYAIMLGVMTGLPTAVARYRSTYWPRRFGRRSLQCALVCVLVPGGLLPVLGLAMLRLLDKPPEAANLLYFIGFSIVGSLFFYFLDIGSSIDEGNATQYVKSISDQAVLTEFALYSGSGKARLEAVGKLEDQKLLAQIARTDREEEVQRQAISRIQNKDILVKLITGAGSAGMLIFYPDRQVALEVVENLDDRPSLERISREAKDETVRKAAAERLAIS